MKILYVASEVSPFVKTGGLADVAGSLPSALKAEGEDISVVMPLYSLIDKKYRDKMKKLKEFTVDLGWRRQYAGIYSLDHESVVHYFIDNEYYFKRNKVYGEFDDGERFIFFSKALILMMKELGIKPDIVHSNDWHSGLVPLYIKDFAKGDKFYKDMKSVFTIHNLKYQGVFPTPILEDIAGLSIDYYKEDGLKFHNSINLMKAGIVYSDALTTVSNTYAEEIKYSFFGEHLEETIRNNQHKLIGIVNGIDYDKYNPETDKNLKVNYNFETIEKKLENKLALQKLFNLPQNKDIPVLGMVSRLVAMKGLDLVKHILDDLLQQDIQLVVLGTGDVEYEHMFKYFQDKYPNKVAARIYFSEEESHLIYAGSDIFLMPSMAEPCGISQLISLRYGTLPIVRETGGLKDTVHPYEDFSGLGNGFSFENFNAHDFLFTIRRALSIYNEKEKWNSIIKQAMESKNDWEESSRKYINLYNSLQ